MTAVRSDDRAAFQQLISDRDPSFGDRARLLYDNLSTLPLADLQIRVEPGERPLADARRAVLGENAWAQPAIVTWRLTGETADAEHQIWLTFVAAANTVQLAGTLDGPATDRQEPSWWLGPVTARRQGSATVIVGAGQPAGEWATVAAESADEVRRWLPDGLPAGWNGRVTFEIPATERDFESVLGVEPGSHRGIAAVAQQEGSSGRSAQRVVVNPRVRELVERDRLPIVLAHETVHRSDAGLGVARAHLGRGGPRRMGVAAGPSGTAELADRRSAGHRPVGRRAAHAARRRRFRRRCQGPRGRVRRVLARLSLHRRALFAAPARPALRRAGPRPLAG